jgi:hypothetical protein
LAQFIVDRGIADNYVYSYCSHQQELDMIPLMVQQDYKPQGWLGLILGTRMWYATNFAVSPLLSFLVSLL